MRSELKLNIISDIDKVDRLQDLRDIGDEVERCERELTKKRYRMMKKAFRTGDTLRLVSYMDPPYLGEVDVVFVSWVGSRLRVKFPKDRSLRGFSGIEDNLRPRCVDKRVAKA